jgi:hypothetical protein
MNPVLSLAVAAGVTVAPGVPHDTNEVLAAMLGSRITAWVGIASGGHDAQLGSEPSGPAWARAQSRLALIERMHHA